MPHQSAWMNPELGAFRDSFRRFLTANLAPRAEGWRKAKMVERDAWRALGEMGALLPSVPEAYGGIGGNFAFEAAVIEDITTLVPDMATGVSVHSAIVAHYILNYGSQEQKQRWLPKMARGEFVGAIAMTEPGAGSDIRSMKTRAERRGAGVVREPEYGAGAKRRRRGQKRAAVDAAAIARAVHLGRPYPVVAASLSGPRRWNES